MTIQYNDSKEISQNCGWVDILSHGETRICRLQVQFKGASRRADSFTCLSVWLMSWARCRVGYFKPLQSRGCKMVRKWPDQNQEVAWWRGLTPGALPRPMRGTLLNIELSNGLRGVSGTFPFSDPQSSMKTGRWHALWRRKKKGGETWEDKAPPESRSSGDIEWYSEALSAPETLGTTTTTTKSPPGPPSGQFHPR